jgi:hypothetical protein
MIYNVPKKKNWFQEWIGFGVLILILSIMSCTGFFWANSNTKYPPVIAAPRSAIDQYRIVTNNGECWVVKFNEKGVTESIYNGENLEACQSHLRVLNSLFENPLNSVN